MSVLRTRLLGLVFFVVVALFIGGTVLKFNQSFQSFTDVNLSGGPAGVGVAVGRAVRSALVLIAVLDFFLGLAIWGTSTSVRVAG